MVYRSSRRGFTLIELSAVLVIVGILLTIAVPSFIRTRREGYDRQAQVVLSSLSDYLISSASLRSQGVFTDPDSAALAARLGDADAATSFLDAVDGVAQSSSSTDEVSVALVSPRVAVVASRSSSGRCFLARVHITDGTSWAMLPEDLDCDAHQPGVFSPSEITGTVSSPVLLPTEQ